MTSQHPEQSFRITTQKVAAKVRLAQGHCLEGSFPCAGHRGDGGPNALAELLNQSAPFVPFFPGGRVQPVLLNKRAIREVEVDPSDSADLDVFGEERAIDLLLDDGAELSGWVQVSAPVGHTRTLDTLNEAGRFLLLRTNDRYRLVNLGVVAVAADAD